MSDPRLKSAAKAYTDSMLRGYREGRDEGDKLCSLLDESWLLALQAADAADDHVRVPREVLQIMRERMEAGDLGTVRWRLAELLGEVPL